MKNTADGGRRRTFVWNFIRDLEEFPSPEGESEKPPSMGRKCNQASKLRILLCLDDYVSEKECWTELAQEGHTVRFALDEPTALAAFSRSQAQLDAVLVDMTGTEGMDTIRRISAFDSGVCLIVALDECGEFLRAFLDRLGNWVVLTKPYEFQDLLAAVGRVGPKDCR